MIRALGALTAESDRHTLGGGGEIKVCSSTLQQVEYVFAQRLIVHKWIVLRSGLKFWRSRGSQCQLRFARDRVVQCLQDAIVRDRRAVTIPRKVYQKPKPFF